jgi:hypothetical protein
MLHQDIRPQDTIKVINRSLTVKLIRLLMKSPMLRRTLHPPEQLQREPHITVRVHHSQLLINLAHFPTADVHVAHDFLTKGVSQHRRYEFPPVQVLMQQDGAKSLHHSRNARPEHFACDSFDAREVVVDCSQLETFLADDELWAVGFHVSQSYLIKIFVGAHELRSVAVVVDIVFDSGHLAQEKVAVAVVFGADDLLEHVCGFVNFTMVRSGDRSNGGDLLITPVRSAMLKYFLKIGSKTSGLADREMTFEASMMASLWACLIWSVCCFV